jgi:hypothetical protein
MQLLRNDTLVPFCSTLKGYTHTPRSNFQQPHVSESRFVEDSNKRDPHGGAIRYQSDDPQAIHGHLEAVHQFGLCRVAFEEKWLSLLVGRGRGLVALQREEKWYTGQAMCPKGKHSARRLPTPPLFRPPRFHSVVQGLLPWARARARRLQFGGRVESAGRTISNWDTL